MNIIKVIPISRGISKEYLSYFTATDPSVGSFVKVPLRKKTVLSLVAESENLEKLKTEVKSYPYPLKKISGKVVGTLRPEFMAAVKKSAEFFAATEGALFYSLIPELIFETTELMTPLGAVQKSKSEKVCIEGDGKERFSHYKSMIREAFAKKTSVFLLAPTISDLTRAFNELSKGIEEYTILLHSGLPKKMLRLELKKMQGSHPVLIIATPSFLSLPRLDVGLIIIEREHSSLYRMQSRPFLNLRTFAEFFANEIQAKIVFGDILLRVETKYESESASKKMSRERREGADIALVDMKQAKKLGADFAIFSDELRHLIEKTVAEKSRLFLFAARRGLAPTTVCSDCGHTVLCERCSAPLVIHEHEGEEEKGRFFLCHRCGLERAILERCPYCASWKLKMLGIGTERISTALGDEFPRVPVFRLDKDSAKNEGAAQRTIEAWRDKSGSVLVGTEMALLYLERVDRSAIVSFDSLFAIPDFRLTEKILYLILAIEAITKKTVLLQTRNPEESILTYAKEGNIVAFYQNELATRKKFGYPPFTVLIKVTLAGKEARVRDEMEKVKQLFSQFEPVLFPAFISTVRRSFIMHLLIKLPKEKWPQPELLLKPRSLPPHFRVVIDPESVL